MAVQQAVVATELHHRAPRTATIVTIIIVTIVTIDASVSKINISHTRSHAPSNLKVENSKRLRTTCVDTIKMIPATMDQGVGSNPRQYGSTTDSEGDRNAGRGMVGDQGDTPEDLAGAKVRVDDDVAVAAVVVVSLPLLVCFGGRWRIVSFPTATAW